MNKKCASTGCNKRLDYTGSAWLPGLLVAILPKCPFCLMAYSGAVTLCSGRTMYPNAGGSSSYLAIGLGVFVLVVLALNYKGQKTITALGISALAILLLVSSQFYFISSAQYYIGTFMLLFGIWYNGSFFYFFNKYLKRKLSYISKISTAK